MALEPSKIHVSLPAEFRPLLEQQGSGQNVDEMVTISLAIEMFLSKRVSLARAAQLAQQSLGEFIDILRAQNLPWMDYEAEDKHLDDMAIEKFRHLTSHDD